MGEMWSNRALQHLPDDLLLPILALLDLRDLESVGAVSRDLHAKVARLGYSQYLQQHPVSYRSLYPDSPQWEARSLIKLNERVESNIAVHRFRASMVGPTWSQTAMPAMDMSSEQLLVAVGSNLHLHALTAPESESGGRQAQAAKVLSCRSLQVTASVVREVEDDEAAEAEVEEGFRPKGGRGDITSVKALRDGQALVAFADGAISRFELGLEAVQTAAFVHPSFCIQSMAIDRRDHVVATATNGQVSIYNAHGSPDPLHSFNLPLSTGRAWSSLLATHSIPGIDSFLALGVTGLKPLQIHPIGPSGEPLEAASRTLQGPDFRSSPYSLLLPPATSRHSPSTLLSAWYDSHLRLFDLRSPAEHAMVDLQDPWSDNALYTCAWLGENHVAAGAARHGLVSVYDIRYPKLGWSCFAPGSSGSPVYAMLGDGGRLWGASEKQTWVLEFDDARAVDEGARPFTTSVEEDAIGGRGDGRWVRGAARRGRSTPRAAALPRSWVVGYEHRDQTVKLFESFR